MKPEWIALAQAFDVRGQQTHGMNVPNGVIIRSGRYHEWPSSVTTAVALVFIPDIQIDEHGQFVKLQGELVR